MANNHITGSRVRFRFSVDNVPVIIRAETIDLEENADEGVDEVCGEGAGRPWIVEDYWTVTVKSYVSDLAVLDAWLADGANETAGLADLAKSASVRFSLSDGTDVQYSLTECTRSPLATNVSGRKARVMQSYKIRARFCKKVA